VATILPVRGSFAVAWSMAENGREMVLAEFGAQVMVSRIAAVCREFLA